MTHSHIIANIHGIDIQNVKFDNDRDASIQFVGIARQFFRNIEGIEELTAERALSSFDDDYNGVWVRSDDYILVLTKCDGECFSPSWN